jgi:hypothetical protein
MSDFADVEQFARQHAACGGLTPTAQSRPGAGGGYLLTITCACGATHDRWVTAEEASQPLPRPSSPPQPRPADASAAALPTTPSAWPARPTPPRPPRIEVSVQPVRRASRGRAVWLVLLLVVALGAGAAAYLSGVPLPGISEQRAVAPHAPAVASPAVTPPPPPPPPPRAALDDIVKTLRQLQADTTPSIALNDYASRVAVTQLSVERLVASAPEPVRARTREVLDVHRLAVGAWRARTVDDKDEWERVGQDPAIDLCPSVKRAADAVSPPSGASRARARGAAVGASLLPLWECAAEKVAALERNPAGG